MNALPLTSILAALLALGLALGLAAPAVAQAADTTVPPVTDAAADVAPALEILDAAGIDVEAYLWERRIVAVMADSPNDPAFDRQMRYIQEQAAELQLRDVVVLFDSDRRSDSALRRMLRPRGFMLAIIDKDGEIKQRRPAPRDVREISAIIDRFPLRRQEMLDRRPAGR